MREARVVFEQRSVHPDRDRRRIVDQEDEVRVAHAGRVTAVEGVTRDGFEVERIIDRNRDERGVERHRSHVDRRADDLAPRAVELYRAHTRGGLDRELGPGDDSFGGGDPRETADPVPAHLRGSTVCVHQRHRAVAPVDSRSERDQAVGADPAVAVAQGRDRARVQLGRGVFERDANKEVVAGGMELGEAHRSGNVHVVGHTEAGIGPCQAARIAAATASDFPSVSIHWIRGSRRNHTR